MVPFVNLAVGDKFLFNSQTWVKVKPVKRSCCTVLYNAHVDGNITINKVFKPTDTVQKVE